MQRSIPLVFAFSLLLAACDASDPGSTAFSVQPIYMLPLEFESTPVPAVGDTTTLTAAFRFVRPEDVASGSAQLIPHADSLYEVYGPLLVAAEIGFYEYDEISQRSGALRPIGEPVRVSQWMAPSDTLRIAQPAVAARAGRVKALVVAEVFTPDAGEYHGRGRRGVGFEYACFDIGGAGGAAIDCFPPATSR